MITAYEGKPCEGMTYPRAHSPALNDEASGASGADSGQGVCTHRADDKFPRFQLAMSWPDGYVGFPLTMECQGWREVGLYISRCLDDGATVCSVVLS